MFNRILKTTLKLLSIINKKFLGALEAYINFFLYIDFSILVSYMVKSLSNLIYFIFSFHKLLLIFLDSLLNSLRTSKNMITLGVRNSSKTVYKKAVVTSNKPSKSIFEFSVGELLQNKISHETVLKKGPSIPKGRLNVLRLSRFTNKSKFPRVRQLCIPIAILGMYINIIFINELYRSFCSISINWVFVFYTLTPFILFFLFFSFFFKNFKK